MENRRPRSSKVKGREMVCALVALLVCCWCPGGDWAAAFCLWPSSDGPSGAEVGRELYRSEDLILYVMKEGECPEDLARRFYGSAEKAWMIEEANRSVDFRPGRVVLIPLTPVNPGGLYVDGYQTVPILTYHHFSDHCTTALCMPIDRFRQQMAYLKREGYRPVTLSRVGRFLAYEEPLPPKAVAITIDDGYRSFYDLAYPILQEFGFKVTLFIYTAFIGNSPNALTWEQLRELSRAGHEIGSHTVSHAELTRRGKNESREAYLERVKRELEIPRQLIRDKVGQEALWLAYPYGRFNNLVINMAEDAGYVGGVTVSRRSNPFFADPFKLGRCQVMNPVRESFAALLETFHREALR